MQDFSAAFSMAFNLIASADADLMEIILLSLKVSICAVAIACVAGFPIGALVSVSRFRGRTIVVVMLNALMGLPPVVIGLLVYMMLSAAGPMGFMKLLYSPTAMIIAQTVLITPLIAALAQQVVSDHNREYAEQFASLGVSRSLKIVTLLQDARYSLLTVAMAGFGRAIAEVGAVIIVGGNIAHLTRVMTTAIALETSKGELALALALGIVLLIISLSINIVVMAVGHLGRTVEDV